MKTSQKFLLFLKSYQDQLIRTTEVMGLKEVEELLRDRDTKSSNKLKKITLKTTKGCMLKHNTTYFTK